MNDFMLWHCPYIDKIRTIRRFPSMALQMMDDWWEDHKRKMGRELGAENFRRLQKLNLEVDDLEQKLDTYIKQN